LPLLRGCPPPPPSPPLLAVTFLDWDRMSDPDKMFSCTFHTGFIDNEYLLFHKEVLDRACKDKTAREFDPDFKMEIFFEKLVDDGSLDALIEVKGDDADAD
jgi:hypothetical protein